MKLKQGLTLKSGQRSCRSVLLIFLLTLSACDRSPDKYPSGVYVTPQHVDVGEVTNSEDIVLEFEIVNTSPQVVHILQVFPSCSCTKVELSRNKLEPMEKSTLKLALSPGKQFGKQKFTVQMRTDFASFPMLAVQIEGWFRPKRIEQGIELQVGNFWPGARVDVALPIPIGQRGEITLANVTRRDCTLDIVKTPSPKTLQIVGNAPETLGKFLIDLDLVGTDGDWETASVVLVGNVISRWQVPPAIYLGFSESSSRRVMKTAVIPRNAVAVVVDVASVEVAFDDDWVNVQTSSCEHQQLTFDLVASFPAGGTGALSTLMQIKIAYTDGDREEFTVPVFARQIVADEVDTNAGS